MVGCRLCFSNIHLRGIFEVQPKDSSEIPLADRINACLPVKVSSKDRFSTLICSTCVDTVATVYAFWTLVNDTQKKFELGDTDASYLSPTTLIEGRSSTGSTNNRENYKRAKELKLSKKKKKHKVCVQDSYNEEVTPAEPSRISNRQGKKRPRTRTYECSVCDYTNASLSNLKIHLMKHNGEFVAKCRHCGKGFYAKSLCRDHELSKHGNDPATPYHCSTCDVYYRSEAYLKRHAKIHDSNFPLDGYQCEMCGKSYATSKGVRRHKMVEHFGQIYQCDACDKKVNSLDSLKNHLAIHRGEKPFVCSRCEKRFRTKNGLKVHERTHSGEKPFQCAMCGSRFSQSSSLKIHLRYHTGERPFQCARCNKKFVTATLLKKHSTRCIGA